MSSLHIMKSIFLISLPVSKINTMNYMGKRKMVRTQRQTFYYKYKDYKKAIVTFDRNLLTNVGLGMRIPEIDDQENV